MESFIDFCLEITKNLGYTGIVILMTIESSFIPFPSEIVIPPAAYLAQKGEMNIYLIILCGIIGSVIGALVNYYLALHLGKPLIHKIARKDFMKYLLITPGKLETAEKYFREHGKISTFIGRLLPAIRQLISLPAGFVKMDMGHFLFYTILGSGIWTTILAILGYQFGAQEELLKQYYAEATIAVIALAAIVVVGYFWFKKRAKKTSWMNNFI